MNKIAQVFDRKSTITIAAIALCGIGGSLVLPPTVQAAPRLLAAVNRTITTTSGAAEIAIANHLTSVGAKMYGAYWCSHCFNQKQLFGKEAWSKVNYIECAADAPGAQPKICDQAKIKGYPTWEINGRQYPGTMSMFKLARASGYKGPTNFQNVPRR